MVAYIFTFSKNFVKNIILWDFYIKHQKNRITKCHKVICSIMSIAFFWCYIKIGNVLFKNLMGATLLPLSIFYLMLILPIETKIPWKIESPFIIFIRVFWGLGTRLWCYFIVSRSKLLVKVTLKSKKGKKIWAWDLSSDFYGKCQKNRITKSYKILGSRRSIALLLMSFES